jgi:4-hydroxybenzoyl-CoA reductase subunit alpha
MLMNTIVGGAFGGKGMMNADLFCSALLSVRTERPVRLVYTREESFLCGVQKHPMVFYMKVGVKKDGKIQAMDVTVFSNTGAYAGYGPSITLCACGFLSLTYRIPNYRFDGKTMYTNIPCGGPHRGFGSQQSRFAVEQVLDMLAEDLGMDPVDIRLKNAVVEGDITPAGWKITSCGLSESLERVRERSGWKQRRGKLENGHGLGVGCTGYIVGGRIFYNYDCAGAFVKFDDDGKVLLIVSSGDSGQGIETTLSQIAAEEAGISPRDIRILLSDTDTAPRNMGAYGSRTTLCLGNACRLAVKDAKEQLFNIVAEKLEAHPDGLEAKDGRIYVKAYPEKGLGFKEAVSFAKNEKGRHILGKGYYDPPCEFPHYKDGKGNLCPAYSFGAGVAEVRVDTETGSIGFLKETQAQDVGRAINPMQCEGQMEGAVVGAMGQLLYEEMVFEEGKALNSSFIDYKIPTAMDIPETELILVETNDPEGPFGAKGMAESPEIPPIGAVANALYDAIGVRIKSLPMTREKVLRALKKKRP